MPAENKPEVWLRGPVAGVPALLQPVVHALLQAQEEVSEMTEGFPDALLWQKVSGLASVGFHLQHLTGVLDRLFTYAKGLSLTELQLKTLSHEGKPIAGMTITHLVEAFNIQVEQAIEDLRKTGEELLRDQRFVGRAQLPSTVLGLLFHGAEHTMRHVGQLLVTIQVLKATSA